MTMDASILKSFREKFSSLHLDSPSKKSSLFDGRDVTRIMEDDRYAKRFLTRKNNVIEDSVKLAEKVLEWRKKNCVNDISIDDVSAEFYAKRSMFVHGRCNDGNRIVYLVGKRFHKEEEAKKLFMYLLETIQRQDPGCCVTFILDASDCGMANTDLGLVRLMVDCFMVYYPCLLGRTFVVALPMILTATWNIVKVWFDEEIRKRTFTCSVQELPKSVEPDQLIAVSGGKFVEHFTSSGSNVDSYKHELGRLMWCAFSM